MQQTRCNHPGKRGSTLESFGEASTKASAQNLVDNSRNTVSGDWLLGPDHHRVDGVELIKTSLDEISYDIRPRGHLVANLIEPPEGPRQTDWFCPCPQLRERVYTLGIHKLIEATESGRVSRRSSSNQQLGRVVSDLQASLRVKSPHRVFFALRCLEPPG